MTVHPAGPRVIVLWATDEAGVCAMRDWRRKFLKKLSPREKQMLTLVSAGLSNKEIAKELGLSPLTVKSVLGRLPKKVRPFAWEAGISQINRTSMATLAAYAGLGTAPPRFIA